MILAEFSFWSAVAIELLKAIFAAVFVAGGAGIVVWRSQERAAHRTREETRQREEMDRNRDRERDAMARQRELDVELEREKRALRTAFVARVTDSAGTFYFNTQHFFRQVEDPEVWGEPIPRDFDEVYLNWASGAELLERELGARFGWNSQAEILWHQVRDLLTVRYFDLRGRNTPGLRRKNCRTSDKFHSGLTETELGDRKIVLGAFHEAMRNLADELLNADLAM